MANGSRSDVGNAQLALTSDFVLIGLCQLGGPSLPSPVQRAEPKVASVTETTSKSIGPLMSLVSKALAKPQPSHTRNSQVRCLNQV